MNPKLRRDLELLSAIVGLIAGAVSLVTWIVSWPSDVVPITLTVVGSVACFAFIALGRVAETSINLAFVNERAWLTRMDVLALATMKAIVMFACAAVAFATHPSWSRVVGAGILTIGLPMVGIVFARTIRRRYSSEPRREQDAVA